MDAGHFGEPIAGEKTASSHSEMKLGTALSRENATEYGPSRGALSGRVEGTALSSARMCLCPKPH
jgi:hypothetical protein